jgi:hypothetical protein
MSTIRIPSELLDGEELLPFAAIDDNPITDVQQLSVTTNSSR